MGPSCIPEIDETLGIKLVSDAFDGNKVTVFIVKVEHDSRHGFDIIGASSGTLFVDIERKLMSFFLTVFFANNRRKVRRKESASLIDRKRAQHRGDLFKPLKEADMD